MIETIVTIWVVIIVIQLIYESWMLWGSALLYIIPFIKGRFRVVQGEVMVSRMSSASCEDDVDIQAWRLRTLEQLRAFVQGNEAIDFQPQDRTQAYYLTAAALGCFAYRLDTELFLAPDQTTGRKPA